MDRLPGTPDSPQSYQSPLVTKIPFASSQRFREAHVEAQQLSEVAATPMSHHEAEASAPLSPQDTVYSLEEEIVFEERNPAHAESDTALLEVLSRRRQTSRRGSLSCSAPELTKTKRSSANKSRGDSNNSNSARKRRSSGVQKGAHDGQQLSAKERVQQNTRRYTSTFLQPTLSSTTKSRDSMGSTQLSSCSTGSVHKATSSLTKPVSPKFRVDTRMRASAVGSRTVLTSEERELQRIAEEREAIKARMQKSNSKFAKRSKDRKSTTANSTITPAAAVNSPAHDGKRTTPTKTNSVGPSRQSAHGSKKKKKLTIPKTPVFRLNKRSEQRKKSLTSSEDTTKPTENKTTGIARVKEKKVLPTTTCHQLTVSRSPKLLTSQRASSAGRSRPLSHEETIQAEMEKIKPFKARQLDRRIFSSNGELGVPKVEARPPTEVVGFDLKVDHRAVEHQEWKATVESHGPKAIPTRRDSIIAITTERKLSSSGTFKCTKAVSPKLKGGRAASAPPRRQKPHHSEIEKQREAGTRSVQKELILTEPKEFKLKTSMRGEAHRASFNMALLKAQEEEAKAREVKARPILASVRKSELPLRSASCDDAPVEKCTKVKPFQLLSEARHEDSIQKMRQRASVLNQPLQSDFKALPLPKSTYEPDFVPSIDAIQPVHHDSVVLESDLRAQKRKEFDQSVRAKLEEIERIEEELENQRVEEQNAKMKELRRKSIEEGGLVFKAKPVMKQDKYPTKSVPQTPLTTAKSPFLQTKTRSALRRKSSSTDVYPSDQQLAQALSQM